MYVMHKKYNISHHDPETIGISIFDFAGNYVGTQYDLYVTCSLFYNSRFQYNPQIDQWRTRYR